MGSKKTDLPPEDDSKMQTNDRASGIPIVRIIEPDETLTHDDLLKPQGQEVNDVSCRESTETNLGDDVNSENKNSGESSKSSTSLHVPLALKFGCHACMQTMKQKYLRHFQKSKRPLVTGLPSLVGGSPNQTPLPVRPNTTLTIYTSHPSCPTGADTVGGSAPGFGHAYYSRRVAAANNASSDRDSFLPSVFRGGVDNGNSGDFGSQQQQLTGELASGTSKDDRSRKAKLRWVDALNTWVPEKKQPKSNPYLSFINAAPRVEKTFAGKDKEEDSDSQQSNVKSYQEKLDRIKKKLHEKEVLRKTLLSLQRTAKLTADRTRQQRKVFTSLVSEADKNRTVRFEAPTDEGIKLPDASFVDDVEEDEEEEQLSQEDVVDAAEPETDEKEEEEEILVEDDVQLEEANESEISWCLTYGDYDIIEPLSELTEALDPTEIPITELLSVSICSEPDILEAKEHVCLDRKDHVTRLDMTHSAKRELQILPSTSSKNAKKEKRKKKAKGIIPKHNQALTKLHEETSLPAATTVSARESMADRKKRKELEDALKNKPPTPPPSPPLPPPEPKPETPPPPPPPAPPQEPPPEQPPKAPPQPVKVPEKPRSSLLSTLPKFTKPPAPKPKPKPTAPAPPPPPVRKSQPPPQPKPQPQPAAPKTPAKPPPPPPPKQQPTKPPPKPKPAPTVKAKPKPAPPPPAPPPPPPKPAKPKEKAPPKPPKPKPVAMKISKPIVIKTSPPEEEEKVKYAEFLPVSEIRDSPLEDELEEDLEEKKRTRSPVKKKEKIDRRALTPEVEAPPPALTPPPLFTHNKRGSIVWSTDGDDDNDGDKESDDDKSSDASDISEVSLSALAPDLPTIDLSTKHKRKQRIRHALSLDPSIGTPRRGPRKVDPALEEERRRQELAEQRRKRQQIIYGKLKARRPIMREASSASTDSAPAFEDYDFLAKYCIFPVGSLEMYHAAFQAVDDLNRGWLNAEETAIALRGVNNRLSGEEEEYLFRIIELTGYKISDGADLKLFSVLAALSHRISALDSWMKLMISEMDFKTLEMKTFLCKNLWDICVEPGCKRISLDQLIVELRSGGVTRRHEEQVKDKLGHLSSMDLLDFLTYSPLFVMIHKAVVDNPLTIDRDK